MRRPNLPNSISIFRILLIPVFMAFLLGTVPFLVDDRAEAEEMGALLAAITFAVAAATDSLDGYVARRRRQVTVLGTFLDPLADKLLISAALVALVQLGELSAWIAMVIIAREFAVSSLRMVAAAEGVIIPASRWGKAKTISQMVAIIVVILQPAGGVGGWSVADLLMAIAVVLTVVSGVDYFVKALERLQPPRDGEPEDAGGDTVQGTGRTGRPAAGLSAADDRPAWEDMAGRESGRRST